ncbi:MAG: type IV secretion system DNA-binding domain-containing protein [Patescibacteria group bacterium]|nr:type IV secretion system DNA-binding domain-containing protein [bacterium]MDZ4240510.1 type IV secretion system DNA-binding domain-containing protein [Patescibacteria group bacterium]
MHDENKVIYFAETDARGRKQKFGIKLKDRSRHVYVIGKTGMGKSTMLENMAIQDIQNGEGMAFVDPHGKTAELLLDYVPESRAKDVIYFAPFDTDHPISFNVMEDVGPDKRHLVANGLMSAFKKIWIDAWSARMEYILGNILLALLEYPDSTLIGVNRMLADKDYRNKVIANITDPSVKAFWTDEFARYGDRYMQEAGAAIQNKIGQFISNPLVRNIIGQPKSTFDLRKVMDEKKILIINLSKGRVGEANANLLGSMLITKIYLGAMSRADASENQMKSLPPFYLFVDEFQSFANESFADILSESRKYKLSLTIAHQYIEQMSEEVRAAVFGNVGTMVIFRVGAYDAEVLEKEFSPEFTLEDMVNLGFTQIYLKLMIEGVTSPPFSATTLPPIDRPSTSYKDKIIEHSRQAFAQTRTTVEEYIRNWHEPIKKEENNKRPAFNNQQARPVEEKRPNPFSALRSGENSVPVKKYPVPPSSSPVPIPTPVPVSLNTLSPAYQQKKKENKGPTQKSLSELKEALADVLAKSEKEEPAEPKKESTESKPPVEGTGKSGHPKEIPESTLKKVLEDDK